MRGRPLALLHDTAMFMIPGAAAAYKLQMKLPTTDTFS